MSAELPCILIADHQYIHLLRDTRQNIEARLATAAGWPAAFFYGLARQGYPTALAPLLVLPSATLRSAIEAAIEANQIPRSLQSELDAIFRRWQALVAQATAEPGRPVTPLRLE